MYIFYVDESGTLDPRIKTEDGKDKEHIYVLTACGLWEGNWHNFYMELIAYKQRKIRELKARGILLNIEDCEVKSTHLRIPKERMKNKFLKHLTIPELTELQELYYSCLEKYNFLLCSAVIDKRYLESHYDRTKLHRKAWELLCERVVTYIGIHHHRNRVLFVKDDISPQENADLARKHSYMLSKGTSAHVSLKRITEMPLFTKSNMNEGLQLADLCAYNVYRAFRYEDLEYPFFQKMLPYFCNSKRSSPNKIDGLKVFPEPSPLVAKAKEISLCS